MYQSEDIKSVANPALTGCNRFPNSRCSGILYLHNLTGNPDERGLSMQRHLHIFAETFPRGSKVPTRVHVVPTVVGGVNPGSTLVQIHFPRLQSAVNSLDANWNTSMLCFRGRARYCIQCRTGSGARYSHSLNSGATGRQTLVTGHVCLIHYSCYSVVCIRSDI